MWYCAIDRRGRIGQALKGFVALGAKGLSQAAIPVETPGQQDVDSQMLGLGSCPPWQDIIPFSGPPALAEQLHPKDRLGRRARFWRQTKTNAKMPP